MTQLGNLEELVLLLVLTLEKDQSYGVQIAEEYRKQIGKSISVPAIHTVLKRLERKKFIQSALGEASQIRGGKRKRIYQITRDGYLAIQEIQEGRSRLWQAAPKLSFK